MEDQIRAAEQYAVDPIQPLPEELHFDLVEVGLTGEVAPVLRDKTLPTLLQPTSTLPIGLPPVLPELRHELEEFLTTPEDIPVHAFQQAQRFWPRERNPDNLFEAGETANPFEMKFNRNPKTGELIDFREVVSDEIGLTAQNSMSFNRKPGSALDPVKGLSSNHPFWPGGIDFPDITKEVAAATKDLQALDIDRADLLRKAPGLEFEVTFDTQDVLKSSGTSSESASSIVNVADIFADDLPIPELDDVVDVELDKRTDSPVVVPEPSSEDVPEELLKVSKDTVESKKMEEKKWAVVDNLNEVKDFHRRVPDMAFKFPFELDNFQKCAVLHLEQHENVLVAAHTSAGKTVVAEYAIALSQKHMRRAIYTSPIKALSNQKFRDFKGTFPEVGLLTGDVQIKPEAPCLIMTTEILRSMLYNGSDVIRDVEWVIFDEIHYINDVERGVVWEEVLIMLPAHVGIILLSATVPNTVEFASWIGRTKQKEVYVVQTKKRPVPLEHYLFTGNSNKTSDELFQILDRNSKFVTEGYRAAVRAKKERASKADEQYGPKGTRQGNPKQDRSVWLSVIQMLKKKDQLPVVAFTLSKKKCDQNAEYFRNVDLVSSSECSHITTFFNRCVSRLKGTDRNLPQVVWMGELLKHGLGVHHSGILPILKEVVEMLFQKGLVKLLFATETFAMGVNMPARTVVFDSTRKFDGKNFRDLLSSEYIQMAGRAGRRGLDSTGMVVILCKGDVQESSEFHAMMLGTPTKLISQFRLTYFMILNLLRVKELTVQDMMKRSFAEYYLQKDAPENEKKLEDLRKKAENLKDPDCPICAVDLKEYYLAWAEIFQLQKSVLTYIFGSPHGQKAMAAGRVVVVSNSNHKNSLAVILQHGSIETAARFSSSSSSSKTPLEKLYTALILCEKSYEDQKLYDKFQRTDTPSGTMGKEENDLFVSKKLFLPQGQSGQVLEEILAAHVVDISSKTLKIDIDKIIDNYKKRLLPRFRFEPPAQSVVLAGQQLLQLAQKHPNGLPVLDPVKDMNLNQIDFVGQIRRLQTLRDRLANFACSNCPSFVEHFSTMRANMKLRENVLDLEHRLSDESLMLIEEYNQRIEVLKEMDYIDRNESLQQKGRVAFEIGNNEMMLTELIINGILTDLKPEEIVALLSCFVFEQKHTDTPKLTASLEKGVELIKETAARLARCQKHCGLDVTEEESIRELRFGLVEVVYEWARGMPFKDITELTDISEGNIVRCIQRLDETCRDVRKAAHVIGVQSLCEKMEEGMSLIRRDIVFAASLYTTGN